MILAVAVSFVAIAFAQEKFTVQTLEIAPGKQSTMIVDFEFEESHDYCSYQFEVVLPEGLTVVGQPVLSDHHPDQSGSINNNEVVVISLSNTLITGSTGQLLEIPVQAAEGLEIGSVLEGKLSEIAVGYASKSGGTYFDDAPFQIKIVDDAVVLDENDTAVPDATDDAVDITVKRTINANEWSTLCLPFDMTEEQVYEAFGQDVQLAEFTSYDVDYDEEDNIVGIHVNFEATDLTEGFYANYPYMIKTSEKITEFKTHSTIAPDEEGILAEYDNGRSGKNRKVYGSFIGTYHAQTVVPANSLFLNGNKFWYSAGKTKMKAFRAYFTFVDVLTSVQESGAKINMNIGAGDATGIQTVDRCSWNGDENVYNLQGQRVGKSYKGIVIENGRKVLK